MCALDHDPGALSRRGFLRAAAGASAATLGVRAVAAADEPAEASPFEVIGYLPEWKAQRFDLATTEGLVSEIVAFSMEPAADGSIDASRLPDAWLRSVREQTRALKQRMLISLGGWGRCEHYPAVAADASLRARHVEACVELCRRHELDGLDIDWEHPQGRQQLDDCAALFGETREAFDRHGFMLTSALPDWVDVPLTGYQALHRVNLMSYDHEGRHATPEHARTDVQRLLDRGVEPSAIALGVPFYGKPFEGRGRSMTYGQIVERYGPDASRDEIEGLYYNGPETIAAKTRFARRQGLAGIMIWEVTGDAPGDESLLRTIRAAARL